MHKKYQRGISGTWIIVGLTIVAIAGLTAWVWFNNRPASGKTNRELALTCTTDMATQFHIHPNVKIVINGETKEIPANVGVTPTCMNSLHTHDASGKIHVESPEKRDFTLSDFFAVWQKTFTKDQILDYKVGDTHEIVMTVNGTTSQDYENLVLRDLDQIVISYQEKKP